MITVNQKAPRPARLLIASFPGMVFIVKPPAKQGVIAGVCIHIRVLTAKLTSVTAYYQYRYKSYIPTSQAAL
jgi:hypothetical protein